MAHSHTIAKENKTIQVPWEGIRDIFPGSEDEDGGYANLNIDGGNK